MKITVLQRPGQHTAKEFKVTLENALSVLKGDLSASVRLEGFSRKGWARIEVDGQDSEILLELIARELGRARSDIAEVEMHEVYQGIVSRSVGGSLEVEIGLETPRPLSVIIGLSTLRAQLADGKPLRGEAIVDSYCLFPGAKASIRITRLQPEVGIAEAWFADPQIE
jgi:hypothetical protein